MKMERYQQKIIDERPQWQKDIDKEVKTHNKIELYKVIFILLAFTMVLIFGIIFGILGVSGASKFTIYSCAISFVVIFIIVSLLSMNIIKKKIDKAKNQS